jgi:hypothetical protein
MVRPPTLCPSSRRRPACCVCRFSDTTLIGSVNDRSRSQAQLRIRPGRDYTMATIATFDSDHNTTSIPSTGIFNITAEQFFCSMVKEADVRCISSAQFAGLPLHELCPSGDCWTDCQDLSRLYAPLPAGITFANESFYGTATTITFWNLCNGLANVTQAVLDGVPPETDTARFQSFLSNSTEANLRRVASATTACWSDTCNLARKNDDCTPKCEWRVCGRFELTPLKVPIKRSNFMPHFHWL